MLKFNVYTKEGTEVKALEPMEFEPTDLGAVKEVVALAKQNGVLVAPADVAAAAILLKGSKRGRASNWTPQMVAFAHEACLEYGWNPVLIQIKLYNKFETPLKLEAITKVLRQETNTEVPLEEGLREKVAMIVPPKGTRGSKKKITPEIEAKIHEGFEAGKTGAQIARELGLSSSAVNTVRRNKVGYRAAAKVGQPLPSKKVEAPEAQTASA